MMHVEKAVRPKHLIISLLPKNIDIIIEEITF